MAHQTYLRCRYMNMAELRYMQDSIAESLTFWRECRDQFFILFMDGPYFVVPEAPPSFLIRALHLLQRLLRFMLCFDSELVNKVRNLTLVSCSCPSLISCLVQNLMLIDAYLILERELEH